MSNSHPYTAYARTPIWQVVEKAIDDLVENGDLAELTRREYIVGYLTKQLAERDLAAEPFQEIREQFERTRKELSSSLAKIAELQPARRASESLEKP